MRSHPSFEQNLNFFQMNITHYPDIGLTQVLINDICAQIQTFLSDPQSVTKALSEFEKKLQLKWQEIESEKKLEPGSFPLIKATTCREGLGLKWRIPDREFNPDEAYYGLLNSTLLESEQATGINLPLPDNDEYSPVASFVGFVLPQTADSHVLQNRIWREAINFAGSLFHGKDTHRLQLIAIFEAVKQGIIKFDAYELKADDLFKLFIYTEVNAIKLWNILLDNQGNLRADSKIDGTTCTNPFYFNNYMMNSEVLPFLSTCVTKQFFKGLININDFQKEIGYFLDAGLSVNEPIARILAHPEAWTTEDTYQNLLRNVNQGLNIVTIDTKDVLLEYLKKGKLKEMPDLASATIQFEQLVKVQKSNSFGTKNVEKGLLHRTLYTGVGVFKQSKTHRRKIDVKHDHDASKSKVIYGKELSIDEIKRLKSMGYSADEINQAHISDIKKMLFKDKLDAILTGGNEDDILCFVMDPHEKSQFSSAMQLLSLASFSDVAAIYLIKDKNIRELFTSKEDIMKFIELVPASDSYFRKDVRINSILNTPKPT